jgi:hypothetical protein
MSNQMNLQAVQIHPSIPPHSFPVHMQNNPKRIDYQAVPYFLTLTIPTPYLNLPNELLSQYLPNHIRSLTENKRIRSCAPLIPREVFAGHSSAAVLDCMV